MNLIVEIDNIVYNAISHLISNNTTQIMLFLSHLGSATTLIILSISFLLLFKSKRDAKYVTINLIVIFILNRIIKVIIARPRPNILRIIEEGGYSFPSGHAMVSMAYYGLLIYLIQKKIKSKQLKYILIAILIVLILGIGISRIYLGVHYFTDVIGGFIISILYLIALIAIYNKKYKKGGKNEQHN